MNAVSLKAPVTVVEGLIKAGANVNVVSATGQTALHIAAVKGASPAVFEALLKAGAKFVFFFSLCDNGAHSHALSPQWPF